MPFTIVRNDVTRMAVDAIVNSTGPDGWLGGADAAIHRAAGPELHKSYWQQGGCGPGRPLLTPAFKLPCRYVIHTRAPVWQGGSAWEEQRLRACYRDAMQLAVNNGLESLAFPLLASGLFGFPRENALCIALDAIRDFVLHNDLMVYLVVYDAASFRIGEKLQQDIRQYIDDRYVAEHGGVQEPGQPLVATALLCEQIVERSDFAEPNELLPEAEKPGEWWTTDAACEDAPRSDEGIVSGLRDRLFARPLAAAPAAPPPQASTAAPGADWEAELHKLLQQQDESFTQRLLRLIDESGMTDPECYRRANVDRRVFSKIRSNPRYQPSKQTAVAFAVALRLSLAQTESLLRTAGLALGRSNHFDLIVSYFIEYGIYDVMTINEALYAFDQPLLGVKG